MERVQVEKIVGMKVIMVKATNSRGHRFEGNYMLHLVFDIVYIHVRLGFIGPYMIVCMYGNCAAGCNQEPVQCFHDNMIKRVGNIVEDDGSPGGPGIGGA